MFSFLGRMRLRIGSDGQSCVDAGAAVQSQDGGRLVIWLPPQEGRHYIIGVDTAGGGSEGDYACAEVVERALGLQCAELRGHFAPLELARRVTELGGVMGKRYWRWNGIIMDTACWPTCEIWSTPNYEKDGQLGWLTSAASRPAMVENMAAVLMAEPKLFHSPRLLEECRTFVQASRWKCGRGRGAHDDCVMAMAIALAVRKADAGREVKKRAMEMASLVVEG